MDYEEIQEGFYKNCKVDTSAPSYKQCASYYTRDGWFQGARWADRKMYWNARKAFCKVNCPDGCPQLKDEIECGGGLVVSCDKLKRFVKAMEE